LTEEKDKFSYPECEFCSHALRKFSKTCHEEIKYGRMKVVVKGGKPVMITIPIEKDIKLEP